MDLRVLVVAGALALTACGSDEESTTIAGTTYTTEGDGTATISNERGSISATDGEAAANTPMPAFAPKYPGSSIESALVTQRDGVSRTIVTFATPDDAKKVAEFYRGKFTGAGMTIKSDLVVEGAAMLSAEADGRKAHLTIGPDDNQSKGSVSFSEE